jgi:Fe/S biogenesis protein NfuA
MTPVPDPVLTVSDKARRRILEVRAAEDDGLALALWVEVVGTSGAEWAYDLSFDVATEASADDVVQHHDELTVVIPWDSVERLQGATLDMSRDLLNPSLVITNPNKPPQQAGPSTPQLTQEPLPELTGTVEERIQTVLDHAINPSLASHGGQASLVAFEEGTAYLRLGGGCVGCGMATVTLSQGIEVAIRDAIPEVQAVVDVTDHASGTNPYYEAAKK